MGRKKRQNPRHEKIPKIPKLCTSFLSTQNDVYCTAIGSQHQEDNTANLTLALNPPIHWFHSIPTFMNLEQKTTSAEHEPIKHRPHEYKHEHSDITAGTGGGIYSISDMDMDRSTYNYTTGSLSTPTLELIHRLHELKSNLHPYCEIVSDLKLAKKLKQRKTSNRSSQANCRDSDNANPNPNPNINFNPSNEFRRASRNWCVNPFESLCHQITFEENVELVCRSALKLCNIDALTGFSMFMCPNKNNNNNNNKNPDNKNNDSTSTAAVADIDFDNDTDLTDTDTGTKGQDHRGNVFVDLCGAPGGFTQYLLFRKWRGYGMSLSGESEDSVGLVWKVQDCLFEGKHEDKKLGIQSKCHGRESDGRISKQDDIACIEDRDTNGDGDGSEVAAPTISNFQIHDGQDGTGDVQNWNNVLSLQQLIEADADAMNKGPSNRTCTDTVDSVSADMHKDRVVLVVADGGIDAQRNENDQETIAHKLICCQVAAALLLLNNGGNSKDGRNENDGQRDFLLKMFGFRTEQTQCLMRSMSRMFDKIQVLKPISSRPASAERYVFFRGFQGLSEGFDILEWRDAMIGGGDGIAMTMTMTEEGLKEGNVLVKKDTNADITTGTKEATSDEDAVHTATPLNMFLESVDRDMLSLNIRACANIVECLREQEEQLLSGKRTKSTSCDKRRHIELDLNTDFIKQQWQI